MDPKTPTRDELTKRRPRSRRVFSAADMQRMHALYYDSSVPVSAVAAAFDVPGSTFLRWIDEMGWPKRRAGGLAARTRRVEAETALDIGPPGMTADPGVLAKSLMVAARSELEAIVKEPLGASLEERERRARLIDSLSRSMNRIDRTLLRIAEVDHLRRQVAAVRATDPRQKEIRAIEHAISVEAIKGIRREFERIKRNIRR